jgi:hypothetical protein
MNERQKEKPMEFFIRELFCDLHSNDNLFSSFRLSVSKEKPHLIGRAFHFLTRSNEATTQCFPIGSGSP